jgi:uncharacterized membrane protein YcaP (DUF421 family)
MRGSVIPDDVAVAITRDYGETANDKVNELVDGLFLAVLTVIALLAFTLGWREALIVAVAIPIVYSLTLITNYLFGFTINRVTLFALILALGLLVDDPIVDVENIYRHLKLRRLAPLQAVLFAVNIALKLLMARFRGLGRLLQGEEVMLIYHGIVNRENARRARISMDELEEAAREHGVASVRDVDLAVLEVDGNISVLSDDFTKRTVRERKPRLRRVKKS